MRNNPIFYAQAVRTLVPDTGFSIDGTDYKTLKFTDPKIKKPTEKAINDQYDLIEKNHINTEYQRQRAQEYPDISLYLDGVVKGDQKQIQDYIDACIAVKNKYPKP